VTRITFLACDVPKMVEGSGFQNQEVRAMQSATRKIRGGRGRQVPSFPLRRSEGSLWSIRIFCCQSLYTTWYVVKLLLVFIPYTRIAPQNIIWIYGTLYLQKSSIALTQEGRLPVWLVPTISLYLISKESAI
jgi:hypothetical protein